ncbi:MAG: alpha/beta hydrolase [Pseudomonadota bacterium]|nr:alpha/beta hydrolase [Pseudomonadota bacterium]
MTFLGKAALGTALAGAAALVLSSNYLDLSNAKSLFSAIVGERGPSVEKGRAYGGHPRQKLDVYHPSSGRVAGPIAVFLYGGNWRQGERSTYGFVGAALAAKGITTVIPDYRLYPEVLFPAFVEDAARAYAWTVKEIAAGRPVYLIGHSAGAHSAALVAFDQRYRTQDNVSHPAPAGVIGLAGPYAFDPTTWETTKAVFATASSADETRPVAQVRPGAPRSLLMHGLGDDVVKLWNLRQLAEALEAAGTPVRKLELDGLGHIGILLAVARPLRWRAPVLEEMVEFMKENAR